MKIKSLVLILTLMLILLCSCGHKHKFADSYSSDDYYHWYECDCGDKSEMAQHTWNSGSITVKPTADSEGEKVYTCTACRAQKTEKISAIGTDHTHIYDFIHSDDNGHWFECACGDVTEKTNHRFNSGVIDDSLSGNGYDVKVYTCLDCSVTKEVSYDSSVTWFDGEEVSIDYAYSFAVVGDTQFLCESYHDKMEAIYDWIVDNKDERRIAQVFGLGDITEGVWDVSNSDAEWIRAKEYISKLDGVVPYSLIRGNHDQISYFEKYFANSTYMSQFDGFMNGDDICNSYKLFRVGSTDYMLLTLDYGASDDVLAWANEVVASHPSHKVIITTHAYLYRDGTTLSIGDMALPSDHSDADSNPMRIYNDGQQMWEKLVSKHPNILLVLSGHDPSDNVVTLQSKGDHGNVVTQMLIDPQGMDSDMGGAGMLCMLYFTADGSEMEVEWYSPSKGQYYKHINQFTLDLSGGANDSHDFYDAHNQTHHYVACDCGYTYNVKAHEFGSNGSCACGYVKSDIYSTATLMTLDGEVIDVIRTKANKSGLCEITPPTIDGYVPEYDKLVLSVNHDELDVVIYYSPISTWDGVSVSSELSGSGTEADPYLIRSAADFVYLKNGKFTRKYFKLTTSINLAGKSFTIPSFEGILDGNHCSIRGINVSSTTNNTGLFSTLGEGSIVHDLSLYGKVSGAQYTGALAGVASGLVRNVVNFATVSGAGNLGGVVGNSANTSRIIDCANYGSIIGSSWNNGGVVGFGQNAIINCVNHGSVKTTGDCAGGVVGSSHSFVTYCINYGDVSASGRAGGIIYNSKKLVDHCVNYGDVNGGWDLGGILGFVAADYDAVVSNCVNHGNVKGTTGVGGVFGFTHETATLSIINCVNNGNVIATWGGGGIAGNTNAEVIGCVNNGKVSGQGELGGIVGKATGKITECVNNGEVVGTNDIIGGIVGHLHLATYGEIIWTTNEQKGSVSGPNAQQIIGKGYVHVDVTEDGGPITEAEFNSQPAMFGSPWVSNNTRMKIVVKFKVEKGTKITFLGDTSIYRWGVMETTDKDNASDGSWKDSGWNTSWTDPTEKTYITTYAAGYLVITVGKNSGASLTQAELDQIHSMFKIEGMKATDSSIAKNNPTLNDPMVSVGHRGWYEAPENTLAAYRESYNNGFKYVECDVQFTKDGVAVLLHDDTIDRTSNGSGTLSQMTYAQLLQYDFSYDSADPDRDFSKYRGEKIPTFEEFIALCKELGLHPYIEIKGTITEAEAKQLVKIVSDAGMLDSVSWLGFSGDALAKIVNVDPTARLVWVLTDTYDSKLAANSIPFAQQNLMTGESEVVFDIYYTLVTQSIVDLLKMYNIPLEVWTVNDYNAIVNLNPYVSGVSSDYYNAKEILTELGKLN